jgi:FkbM family methyltransferase
MRLPMPMRFIKNWVSYYSLKAGIISKATLVIRSKPDTLSIPFSKDDLARDRDHVKQLLKLVAADAFAYDHAKGAATVLGENKGSMTIPCDHRHLATVRLALDTGFALRPAKDARFFQTSSKGIEFLVRKTNQTDLATFRVVCCEDEYGFLYPYVKGSRILDVGANIGDTAVLFAKMGAAYVESYEIHPVLAEQARLNIELNDVSARVKICPCGIAPEPSTFVMRDDTPGGPTAGFGLQQARHGKEHTVNVVSMRDVLTQFGEVDLLKMDIEGAEYAIFESMSKEELRKIKVIGLEYHRGFDTIAARLRDAGFSVTLVTAVSESVGILLAVRQ